MMRYLAILMVVGMPSLVLYLHSINRPPGQSTTILLDGICRPDEKAVVFVNAIEITVECEPTPAETRVSPS